MYLSHGVLGGGVFPHPPNAVYPTLTTAPFSPLLNASYPIPMAYYDNISDADIHFTSSVPEGLEAYRFPCQTSTTENVSDADVDSTSSMPGELEAYPFPGHMSATENISDTEVYPTSSMPGELEAYPFLGQMSATENISDADTYLTSVPCELGTYPFLNQMSATLADPWNMAEQPNTSASFTTGFGATTSYGTYHCRRLSLRLVSDARTSRAGGFHLVRHTRRWL